MKLIRRDQKEVSLAHSDTKVIIRLARVKEVKNIIKDVTSVIKEAFDFYSNTEIEDDEVLDVVSKFIFDNIDRFESYVLGLTEDFTRDDFDDLTILDAKDLIKAIMEFNGIKGDFFKDFFQNLNPEKEMKETPESFIQEIPKV